MAFMLVWFSVTQYGVAMLVTTDEKLDEYITNVLSQLKNWLLQGEQAIALVHHKL